MQPKVKNILMFAGVAIALVLVYIYFIKGDGEGEPGIVSSSPTTGGITVADPSDAPTIGNEFLGVLLSIKSIKLEDSIFATPAFTSLRDSTIQLDPDGNEGRVNPFAPIGTDKGETPN